MVLWLTPSEHHFVKELRKLKIMKGKMYIIILRVKKNRKAKVNGLIIMTSKEWRR